MDAFQEGYHIDGIHPELLNVIVIDPAKSRFNFFGDHNLAFQRRMYRRACSASGITSGNATVLR